MSQYQVIIGNIGTVYQGVNGIAARNQFNAYVAVSQAPHGRGAGEPVTLMQDDDIIDEYPGTNSDD